MRDTAIKAPPPRWKGRIDVLCRRLVESWTRIGLLFLLTGLIALGILMTRPKRRGRCVGDRSRKSGLRSAENNTEQDRAQGGLSATSSKDACGDAEMKRRRGRENSDDWGLDVEDTCITQ